MTFKLFGSIRYAAGFSETDIEVPSGITVYQLLRFAICKYGENFKEELFLPGETGLRDDLTVVVNGRILNHSETLTTKLESDTIITLLPVFPGGG